MQRKAETTLGSAGSTARATKLLTNYEHSELLSDDADLLRQCRAAHWPCVHDDCGRDHCAAEEAARLRRCPDHRHRRARDESRTGGWRAREVAEGIRGYHLSRLRRDVEEA